MKKNISIILLFIILFGNIPVVAETLDEIQDEISSIQDEYDQKSAELEDKQQEYDDLVKQLKSTNEEIETTENEITDTENEITIKEAEVKNLRDIQIPEMERKSSLSLEFAQDNMNNNIVTQFIRQVATNEHPLEVAYGTNKIIEQLYNNLIELGNLLDQVKAEEEALRIEKDQLTLKQAKLDEQKDYLKDLQDSVAYSMSKIEEQQASDKEELAAQKEKEKLFEEAGCGPNDVYGVDCAQAIMPAADGDFVKPLEHGTVTNEYGGWSWYGESSIHSGIDLANSFGTPVYPTAPGKVLYSGGTSDGGGESVIVLHVKDGVNYISRYCHLSSENVSTGDVVDYGQQIGTLGSSGNVTGAHLHFEMERQGSYVWSALENPRSYVDFPPLGGSW